METVLEHLNVQNEKFEAKKAKRESGKKRKRSEVASNEEQQESLEPPLKKVSLHAFLEV